MVNTFTLGIGEEDIREFLEVVPEELTNKEWLELE